jgi:hypothetical protein
MMRTGRTTLLEKVLDLLKGIWKRQPLSPFPPSPIIRGFKLICLDTYENHLADLHQSDDTFRPWFVQWRKEALKSVRR